MLIDRIQTTGRTIRSFALVSTLSLFSLAVISLSTVSNAQDDSSGVSQKCFVSGTVTDAETGKPIADATITILVRSEQDPEKRSLSGITDEEGDYLIAVPMGQVSLWFPPLKSGYWLPGDIKKKNLVTSPDAPIATCDLQAKSAPTWNVQAVGLGDDPRLQYVTVREVADDDLRAAWIKGEPVTFKKSPESWYGKVGADGTSAITEVGESRKLLFSVGTLMGELIADKEFDNTNVVSVEPTGKTIGRGEKELSVVKLTDRAGHHATVSGVEVTLSDGKPLLTGRMEPRKPIGIQVLRGRVVDEDKKPIVGVRVGLARGTRGRGSASQGNYVTSGKDGGFEFQIEQFEKKPSRQYSVSLVKDGYAARDSKRFDVNESFGEIDAGDLELAKGNSANVRVVDRLGIAAPGAVVEPTADYALRAQAERTDSDGNATIHNLPVGLVRVAVRFGDQYRSAKLIVSGEPTDEVTTITLRPKSTAPENYQPPTPLAVGQTGPELQVAAWSDDRTRTLAEFRGKMVVLDFWGVWCGPCVSSIPAMQKIADRYSERGVVFLGVHTAGGSIDEVNKLKKLKEWTAPSAIDQGTNLFASVTCKAYGVSTYPAIVILDQDGKIAYRSDVMPSDVKDRAGYIKKMKKFAKENGLTLPGKDTPREEAEETMTQFQVLMFSEQIEQLMDAQ